MYLSRKSDSSAKHVIFAIGFHPNLFEVVVQQSHNVFSSIEFEYSNYNCVKYFMNLQYIEDLTL